MPGIGYVKLDQVASMVITCMNKTYMYAKNRFVTKPIPKIGYVDHIWPMLICSKDQ